MARLQQTFETPFETYSVVKPIGQGGSGQVFEVTDSEGKSFALKVLTPTASRAKIKRFKNEINFCLKPLSKRIIKVQDFGRTNDGALFYVMPLFAGSLEKLIEKGIEPDKVLGIFDQILDGVEAAHLNNVFHRDIKPANILQSHDEEIVVADFGIAHFHEEHLRTLVDTHPSERLANFGYSAPEQRKRGSTVDQRADVYALGLILNEMFTRHVPQGSGYADIRGIAPQFSYLDGLVDKMIRQQPEDRHQSVRQVKEDLIANGNRFVELQRLDVLNKQVIPETEVSDPIVRDPIRPVEIMDYSDGSLSVRLNRPVNEEWKNAMLMRANTYSSNFSVGMVTLHGDVAYLRIGEPFAQMAVNMFRQFCESANEAYKEQVTQAHLLEVRNHRAALAAAKAQQEQKLRVLGSLQL